MCSFSVAYAWTGISFDQSLREKSSLIGVDIYIYIYMRWRCDDVNEETLASAFMPS